MVAKDLCFLVAFHIAAGAGDQFPNETQEEVKNWQFCERVVLWAMKHIPDGSFLTTDRYFTTPAVAAYAKKYLNKYLTGTLMSNRAGVDKSLQFLPKNSVPRGYFKWSEDEFNRVYRFAGLTANLLWC